MVLKFLKSNQIAHLILIPLAGILLWLPGLIHPESFRFFAGEADMPLYRITGAYLQKLPFLSVFVGLAVVVVSAFFINQISTRFQFLRSRSGLPGIIYLLTVSAFPSMHTLHPVHLASLFVFLAIISIFDTYHQSNTIPDTFNAAFFLSVGSLFYFPTIFLFPITWISIAVFQKGDNWRLLFIPLVGFVVPWFIAAGVYYLNDILPQLFSAVQENVHTANVNIINTISFQLISGLFIFLAVLGSSSILSRYDIKKISSRKYFIIFYWMVAFLVVSILFSRSVGIEAIILLAIPFSYIIAHFFIFARNRFWPELLFYLFLGTIAAVMIIG